MDKKSQQLLKLVCSSSDGLQFFQIHRRLFMSPRDIAHALSDLESEGLVEVSENKVKPTDIGYLKALSWTANQTKKSRTPVISWKDAPPEFVAPRMEINKPYAPSFEKFLRNTKKG